MTQPRKGSYPADFYDEDGRGRIHQGHDVAVGVLRDDMAIARMLEVPFDLRVQQVWLTWHPRVKWCHQFNGVGCEMDGEWHAHWEPVPDGTEGCQFTLVHAVRAKRARS